MGIKKDYIKASVDSILMMYPSLNKNDVEEIVTREVKTKLKDPNINMSNSVKLLNQDITLTKLCSWIDKEKPVVSGNATFYCQPEVIESPTSFMLKTLKVERKQVKNKMFKCKFGSQEYEDNDLDQGNKKVIMNAEYGGSGTPTAAFYTKEGPAATTLMAQSIITTMAALFEGYVGDNQKFFHINECFDWMNRVILKDQTIPKWIKRPSVEEVIYRIKTHFYLSDVSDYPFIESYIRGCTSDQQTYLYYANNIKDFIYNHPYIINLLRNVLSKLPLLEAVDKEVPDEYKDKFPFRSDGKHIEDYNKWVSEEMFLNPYKIPNCIKDDMESFISLMTQFIYVEYITPDSIVKLNNHYRNTVLLVDTDSNIINADLFVSFVINEIFLGETFHRSKLYNEMILVNVLAASLDRCVALTLDYYGRCHNMNKEARSELTMKNEFMFRRFFLMTTKKRYAASIVLREGNIMIPFKLEIKGLDFIKAGVTDNVTERFTKMLEEHVLFSDELELHELMRDLKRFENEIYEDLKKGGTEYLKPQMYKPEGAYKKVMDKKTGKMVSKAWSLQIFRGSTVWNELYPSQKIYSLNRAKIIKLIVSNPEDLNIIKDKYPEEYDLVMRKIFHSNSPDIQKAGLKVICIPNELKKIPDWIIPLIDKHLIVSDVISSFRSVLESLKLEDLYFKTPNGKANVTSCLISL